MTKKPVSITQQHENQILKLNAASQNYNQQYWTSKNNLKSKYNQIQQSISRTRHSDSKDNSQMFSIMLWKGVPMLVKESIYLSLILKIYLLIFYPTVDCLYVWSLHWSLLPLVWNLPDQPIILKCALFNQVSQTCFQILSKKNGYNLGTDFSNWTDLKEFYQWMDCSGQW